MQTNKLNLNPLKIVCVWTLLMSILTPFLMYFLSIGKSGGEQVPLTTLSTMLSVTIYGFVFLSIITAFFYRQWFKQNLWFIVIIFLPLAFIVKVKFDDFTKSHFDSSTQNIKVGNDDIKIMKEYYDTFKTIRSISFWKNDKRDSVWKVFSKEGKIIKQQTFRNDTLIKNKLIYNK